jgi:hypothetical protein
MLTPKESWVVALAFDAGPPPQAASGRRMAREASRRGVACRRGDLRGDGR